MNLNLPITDNPLLEGERTKEEEESSYFKCRCKSVIHPADLKFHSTYCNFFQPNVQLGKKLLDPELFIANGLSPPARSPIKLRIRKRCAGPKSYWKAVCARNCSLYSDSYYPDISSKMSECEGGILSYGELGEAECVTGNEEEPHESLSTPPPTEQSQQGTSPMSVPPPPVEMSFEVDETKPSHLGIIDELISQGEPLFPSPLPMLNSSDETHENGISSPPEEPPPKKDLEKIEEETEKVPEKKEEEKDEKVGQPGGIRMRSMVDLIGTNGVKEEKVEEPFAALNVMLSNLKSPQAQQSKNDFEGVTTISSQPLPSNSIGGDRGGNLPNLPPGVQISVQKRPANFPPGVSITKQPRRDSESSSTSSLSPSATPPPKLPEGITLVKPGQKPPSSANDPVANMLATRGVSVMPSSPRPDMDRSISQAVSIRKASPSPHNLLNNTALTITATPPKRSRGNAGPVMTTVDLTDDSIPPMRRPVAPAPMVRPRMPGVIGRGRSAAATCDVCDKVFAHAEALRTHMQTHAPGRRGGVLGMPGPRAPGIRQPMNAGYPSKPEVAECRFCTARYPNQQLLLQHTQRFHPEKFGGAVGSEFALPVVDLMDSRTMANLVSIGVKFCIPLNHLEQAGGGGLYGLPVVSMDGAINPAVCNIDKLNCSNLFPLGPMKGVRRQ